MRNRVCLIVRYGDEPRRHGDAKRSHGGESTRGGRRNSKHRRSMEDEQFQDVRERSANSFSSSLI